MVILNNFRNILPLMYERMLTRKKIILFVLLLSIITIVFGWMAIGEQKNHFMVQAKEMVPEPIKSFLKNTVLVIPRLLAEGEVFKKHLKEANEENGYWKRKDKVITGIIRNEMNMKNRHSAWERYFDFYRPIVPCPKSANVI